MRTKYKTLIFRVIFLVFIFINLQETVKKFSINAFIYTRNSKEVKLFENEMTNTSSSSSTSSTSSTSSNVSQILIVTYWRSGSTWLGNLLSKMPQTFYVYEPLHVIRYHWGDPKIHLYHGTKVNIIEQLFNCVLPLGFVEHLKSWKAMYRKRKCKNPSCFLPQTITKECIDAKFRIIKTVRLYLQEIEDIFLTPSMKNLKVIYLVRDPRGVMNSILHMPQERIDTTVYDVCQRMRGDVTMYPTLKRLYPDRIFFLRYEDLANDKRKAEELWCFIHGKVCSQMSSDWVSYLKLSAEPKANKTAQIGSYKTEKKSSQDWQIWRQIFPNKSLIDSEYYCGDVIDTLGYRRFGTIETAQNLSVSALLYSNCTQIPCNS